MALQSRKFKNRSVFKQLTIDYNSGHQWCPDFNFELLPLQSPLLRQSLLISFPPPTDMLKFSGWSYLISGSSFVKNVEPLSSQIHVTTQRLNLFNKRGFLLHLDLFRFFRHTDTSILTEASANYVQRSIIRGIAVHNAYRISPRSSSNWEPRHPSLKIYFFITQLSYLFFE